MTSPRANDDHSELLARVKAGDQAAWEELFYTCWPKVIRVIRRKLDRPMRSLYDSTDFAGDVMKSLAANLDRLDFPSINSLMAFLAQVAEQKVIDEHRRQHTQKRDITRGRPLSHHEGADHGTAALASPDPSPSQMVQAEEVREQFLANMDGFQREVFELKQQGYSNAEIAERTGWNIRKLQRFWKELYDSWSHSGAD